MTITRKAQLHLEPGRARITVDGQDLRGVTAVAINASMKAIAVIQVSLALHEVEVEGEMRVVVPERTQDALIALGWTPPAISLEADAEVSGAPDA